MDWDDLRYFAAFVEAGSLSGAARALAVEHATVARRIAALEARLGMKLVDRRGRRLRLTADGEKVAALAGRMGENVQAVDRLASGARSELVGEVTVSVPPVYGAMIVAPRLAHLIDRHPGLSVRILGQLETAALERREADIAIRLSRPETGDLTAARIDTMAFHLFAHPAYLDEAAEADWTFVGLAGLLANSPQAVAASKIAGKRRIALLTDQTEMQLALVAAGGGVAMLPEFMALGRHDLTRVKPNEPALVRDIWMVVHSDMKSAAPIRTVMEALRCVKDQRS